MSHPFLSRPFSLLSTATMTAALCAATAMSASTSALAQAGSNQFRRDSIAATEAARREMAARHPRAANTPDAPSSPSAGDRYLFKNSGFYMGAALGSNIPTGGLNGFGYEPGFHVNVPIGFHQRSRALGVRLDLDHDRFGSGAFVVGRSADGSDTPIPADRPKVLSAALSLTAHTKPSDFHSFSVYALGGAGLYRFSAVSSGSELDQALGDDVLSSESSRSKTRTKFGVQGGAGVAFGKGPITFYAESRLVNVFTKASESEFPNATIPNANGLRWLPLMIGITVH